MAFTESRIADILQSVCYYCYESSRSPGISDIPAFMKKEASPAGEALQPLKAGAGSPDQRSGAEKEGNKDRDL